MPRIAKVQSRLLSFELEEPDRIYMPGDTIIGTLNRYTPGVIARARVDIKLCGRAKAKIDESHRNSGNGSTYRSRFLLIDDRETRQALHDGPVHIAPDESGESASWPFAVTIPTKVRPGLSRANDGSYIALDEEQTLPPSFFLEHGHLDVYVEYWLEASIRGDAHGGDVYTATLPLRLRNYSSEPPIADYGIRIHRRPYAVFTQRLVPGMEKAQLTAKDKMKKFFSTSSVPGFNFTLEAGVPSVIQLEHDDPVPFTLRAVPNWDMTSEIIRGVPQKMAILHFGLKISALIHARADGSFRLHEDDEDVEIDLHTQSGLAALKKHIMIPCTDEWPAVNVGEALGLRVGYNGSRWSPKQHPQVPRGNRLFPSGTTYNIRIVHRLEWEFTVHVAGENRTWKGMAPLTLLPAADSRERPRAYAERPPPLEELRSDSWIVPPPEGDAPPSFTQVQKEDMVIDESKGSKTDELQAGPSTEGESSGAGRAS